MNQKTLDPVLISADDLAALMQISTRTLWRLLSAKQVPKPIRLGGSTRWRLDQVRKWIEQGCPPQEND
jgi:predicted DNA-binding transcriptional regulator AlpA